MGKRLPMSIPYGWFFIAYADDLPRGKVQTVHYFNKEMVLFRTENGEIGLLDAFCLHMGAHLGHGGKVEGESIRCPFHDWKFNTKGQCTEVPYSKTMPPSLKTKKKCQKTYHAVEKNKVIWAWYHPEDKEPFFDVMEHDEIGHPDWVELEKFEWRFASNPQEIAENGVDVAHFQYVHGMASVPEGKTTYDGVIRKSMAEGTRDIKQPDGSVKTKNSRVETIQNGAGQKYTRISGLTDTFLMVLATPITHEDVELRFAFTYKKCNPESMEYKAAKGTIKTLIGKTGVEGDIPIWENKIFHKYPLLCDGDGPIMRFRKYFGQFYCQQNKLNNQVS